MSTYGLHPVMSKTQAKAILAHVGMSQACVYCVYWVRQGRPGGFSTRWICPRCGIDRAAVTVEKQ